MLDKPVVTLNTLTKALYRKNIDETSQLVAACDEAISSTLLDERRQWIISHYNPYADSRCAEGMLAAAADYISRHDVPDRCRPDLWRKYVSIKTFGRIKRNN